MRKIILILFLLTLVSSNKFLEKNELPEELDDEIILQKGGFGGGFRALLLILGQLQLLDQHQLLGQLLL